MRLASLYSSAFLFLVTLTFAATPKPTLEFADHWLTVHGGELPGGSFRINYLEA